MPTPYLVRAGEDIVYALGDKGESFKVRGRSIRGIRMSFVDSDCVSELCERDERTGLNKPLVYRLCHQVNCRVAMFGRDKC